MPKIIVNQGKLKKEIFSEENTTICEIARKSDMDIEGSCEGSLACSTCHVIVSREWINKINPPNLEELEMLDLLPNICKNSRLGCQIKITDKLDGLEITIPEK